MRSRCPFVKIYHVRVLSSINGLFCSLFKRTTLFCSDISLRMKDSFFFLIIFSACSAAALNIGCQSSTKESSSERLVQRVLGTSLVDSTIWGGESTPVNWTWRTQWLGLEEPSRGVGTGGILVIECKVLECGWVFGVVVCVLWKNSKFGSVKFV